MRHNNIKKEWDRKSDLIDFPWCENWKEMIDAMEPKPKPSNIHPSFRPGFKSGNKLHEKRSAKSAASISDSSSYQETVYNESRYDKVEMAEEIQKQEEAKAEFSVPLVSNLKNKAKSTTTSILGKRKGYNLTAIDEPTEEEMRSSCEKVDAMFDSRRRKEFDIPTPMTQTVYVS